MNWEEKRYIKKQVDKEIDKRLYGGGNGILLAVLLGYFISIFDKLAVALYFGVILKSYFIGIIVFLLLFKAQSVKNKIVRIVISVFLSAVWGEVTRLMFFEYYSMDTLYGFIAEFIMFGLSFFIKWKIYIKD